MAGFREPRGCGLSKALLMIKKIFFAAAFGLLFVSAKAQEDYPRLFSSNYDNAIEFLAGEEKWMNEIILSYGLKPAEVKAVVFPELIRYNSIRDKIEIFALESLYIQHGKAYANFSVGQFQIKPSFAESIEVDFLKTFGESKSKTSWNPNARDTIQNIALRDARLKRLKDKKAMLSYVCLFFKVLESKYPVWKTTEEKIKFFASAYNFDYRKSASEINEFLSKRFFYVGFISSKKYSYANVALYFYQHNTGPRD
jgi:hypothetical protein